jgi:hypothetical protein
MGAILVLLTALPAGTAWGAATLIELEYDWNGTCVSDIDFVNPADKNLTLSKKQQKIRWSLVPRTDQVTKGDWEVEAAAPAELCKTKYKDSASKTYLECQVKKAIKYEYELKWSDVGCNGGTPVIADPVIIFDDGSGGSGG